MQGICGEPTVKQIFVSFAENDAIRWLIST